MDYYPLSDLLYRSVALTDEDKEIVEAYDTDAYGNTLVFDDPGADDQWFTDDDATTKDPICPFIFTGRRYEPETQIYYYRARYYHTELGRFLARDPVLYSQGANIYEYVRGCGTSATDPLGQQGFPDFGVREEAERQWAANRAGYLTPEQERKVEQAKREAALDSLRKMLSDTALCLEGIARLKLCQAIEARCESMATFNQALADAGKQISYVSWGAQELTPVGVAAELAASIHEGIAEEYRKTADGARRGQRKACEEYIIPYCCPDVARRYCSAYMG